MPQGDSGKQLCFLGTPSAVVEELLAIVPSSMTPLEAITKLYDLSKKAREQS